MGNFNFFLVMGYSKFGNLFKYNFLFNLRCKRKCLREKVEVKEVVFINVEGFEIYLVIFLYGGLYVIIIGILSLIFF